MKIYTRTGDGGETGLFGGGRVPKGHGRVEAYGTVDELNATLGMCVVAVEDQEVESKLLTIQQDLFSLGASLATPGSESGQARPSVPDTPAMRIGEMEEWIDTATDECPELRSFILPGGTTASGVLHLARAVCRRAERTVERFARDEPIDGTVLPYLNRLSDLLFALARLVNHRQGVSDVLWDKGS
jgi:cob(I)alamin adenosyltransferase